MLTTQKAIAVTGSSTVTEGEIQTVVVSMYANIRSAGNTDITTTIINQELYEANKAECRTDIDEFTAMVREVEDTEVV